MYQVKIKGYSVGLFRTKREAFETLAASPNSDDIYSGVFVMSR